MARQLFTFAEFKPSVWLRPHEDTAGAVISQLAPKGVVEETGRERLETVFTPIDSVVHDSFNAFSVKHDKAQVGLAYEQGTDEPVEKHSVHPRYFNLYEFRDSAGRIYVSAPPDTVRQMLRRAQAINSGNATLRLRILDLKKLEQVLRDSSTFIIEDTLRYKFDSLWYPTTPLDTMTVQGSAISDNRDVQGAKGIADTMSIFAVSLRYDTNSFLVQFNAESKVTFLHYPGDTQALGLLEALEPTLESCSDMASVRLLGS